MPPPPSALPDREDQPEIRRAQLLPPAQRLQAAHLSLPGRASLRGRCPHPAAQAARALARAAADGAIPRRRWCAVLRLRSACPSAAPQQCSLPRRPLPQWRRRVKPAWARKRVRARRPRLRAWALPPGPPRHKRQAHCTARHLACLRPPAPPPPQSTAPRPRVRAAAPCAAVWCAQRQALRSEGPVRAASSARTGAPSPRRRPRRAAAPMERAAWPQACRAPSPPGARRPQLAATRRRRRRRTTRQRGESCSARDGVRPRRVGPPATAGAVARAGAVLGRARAARAHATPPAQPRRGRWEPARPTSLARQQQPGVAPRRRRRCVSLPRTLQGRVAAPAPRRAAAISAKRAWCRHVRGVKQRGTRRARMEPPRRAEPPATARLSSNSAGGKRCATGAGAALRRVRGSHLPHASRYARAGNEAAGAARKRDRPACTFDAAPCASAVPGRLSQRPPGRPSLSRRG